MRPRLFCASISDTLNHQKVTLWKCRNHHEKGSQRHAQGNLLYTAPNQPSNCLHAHLPYLWVHPKPATTSSNLLSSLFILSRKKARQLSCINCFPPGPCSTQLIIQTFASSQLITSNCCEQLTRVHLLYSVQEEESSFGARRGTGNSAGKVRKDQGGK